MKCEHCVVNHSSVIKHSDGVYLCPVCMDAYIEFRAEQNMGYWHEVGFPYEPDLRKLSDELDILRFKVCNFSLT